jgi:hypothetical protein
MKKVIVLGVACVLGVAGCSGIRVVRASKSGGEIALIGDREQAKEKAIVEMERTCGGPQTYVLVEEYEAVVGEVSDSRGNAQAGRGIFGNPEVRTSEHTETTQKTEWRVKYECKGAAQPAPAGNPPAGAPPVTTSGTPSSQLHEVIVRF